MIEVYLFLAMFPAQILGMSVLYPILLTRAIRTGLNNIPPERLPELYPGVDVAEAHERFLARYRVANTVLVVVGVVLLGWFISYTRRPGWDEGSVGWMVFAYCMLQNAPILLISWFTTRFNKVHKRSLPEAKRKAVLKRRGLFDFVSPVTVLLAVLANLEFVGFMFYVKRHPFPDFGGPFLNIGITWLGYILLGALLYGVSRRKKDPLQTHAERMIMLRAAATAYTWVCIFVPISGSITVARKLVDLEETWGPFAGTVFFLILTLFNLRSMTARPRQLQASGLASNPAPPSRISSPSLIDSSRWIFG